MSTIPTKRIDKLLTELYAHTATTAQANQKYFVPFIATNDDMVKASNRMTISIENVEEYRFDSRWYSYKFSADRPNETFSILRVDNIFTTNRLNSISEKCFTGMVATLVYQGIINPFILIIDDKVVSWDRLELIYDSGDTWLLVRGSEFNHYKMSLAKSFKFIILPYRCEFFGIEPDELFDVRYAAFCEYIQQTSYTKNKRFFIASPTLTTSYVYRDMTINLGGWAYTQIKRYGLGILPEDRIEKLRQIPVSKVVYNSNGDAIDTIETKFNLFDMDVPTDEVLSNYLYGMTAREYENCPCFNFTPDGYVSADGEYLLYVTDEKVGCKIITIDDSYIWDLSELDNLLFRENFLVFRDGVYDENFSILTAINNVVLLPNPRKDPITVVLIYDTQSNHVIRHSDRFFQSYMTEQAKLYFEAMLSSAEDSGKTLPNRDEPNTGLIDAHLETEIIKTIDVTDKQATTLPSGTPTKVYLLNKPEASLSAMDYAGVDAHLLDGRVIKGITAFTMDTEVAYVPSVDDYIVFLERYTSEQEAAVEIISKLMQPLDFTLDKKMVTDENREAAIDAVVKYDPALLNPLYRTTVDQYSFTGKQANASLIYDFMYEKRRGIKIPRKLYKNHETYFMLFVNGELFERYSNTICFANFFLIPVEDSFEFDNSDIIEVLYFKGVNNNELRFYLSDCLLEQFQTHSTNRNFYDASIFKRWIEPNELKIFSHYPRDMIYYPTLIPKESEEIAFNISYRDEDGNLCLKKDGLTHIVSENVRAAIEAAGQSIPDDISSAIDDVSIDTYKEILKDNTFVVEHGVNVFNQDTQVTRNALVAVSSHKFIYQRLYPTTMAYRLKLDKRFRYCDNPRQYLLFINGRRMRQDSFLVTIPKHTLPFNGIYLYTAKFVGPKDRVELFYLPYDMTDINFNEDRRFYFSDDGYFHFDRNLLRVPLSKDFYLFFINGKKIPASEIIDIDSNTIRVKIDTATTRYPMVTVINTCSLPQVESYLQSNDDEVSHYDAFIRYIKNRSNGINLLNDLFNSHVRMSEIENDKIWMNVAKIAILNEVIRDFWVTSGYDYHSQPFVYDYDDNEYFTRDEHGNLILTALNGIPEINIKRNDISLLYFYTDPIDLLFEYGREIDKISFFWEYSQRFNQENWQILWQRINDIEIPVEDRTWTINDVPEEDTVYRFMANTGQQIIVRTTELIRANGTYWGMIDEEELKYYHHNSTIQYTDELVAVIPKDGVIPSRERQELESGNPAFRAQILDLNYIVHGLTYGEECDKPIDLWFDPTLQNVDDDEYLAIFLDGREVRSPYPTQQRMDRADDVMYWYPGALFHDDGRFVVDLDITEVREVDVYETHYNFDAVNIVDDGFWAITETKGELHDLIYAQDWHLMPQEETVHDITDEKYFAIFESGEIVGFEQHTVMKNLQWEGMTDVSTPPLDLKDHDFDMFDEGFMAIVPALINTDEAYIKDLDEHMMTLETDDFMMVDLDTGEDFGHLSFGPDTHFDGPILIADLDHNPILYGADWFSVDNDSGLLIPNPNVDAPQKWFNLFADEKFPIVRPSELLINPNVLMAEIEQSKFICDLDYETISQLHPIKGLDMGAVIMDDLELDSTGSYDSDETDGILQFKTPGWVIDNTLGRDGLDAEYQFALSRPHDLALTLDSLQAQFNDRDLVYDLDYETISNIPLTKAIWDAVIIDDVDAIDLESVNANYSPSIMVDFDDRDQLLNSGWALTDRIELNGGGLLADTAFQFKIASEFLLNPNGLLAELSNAQVVYDLDYETISNTSLTEDTWDAVIIDDVDAIGLESVKDYRPLVLVDFDDRDRLISSGWALTERGELSGNGLLADTAFQFKIASELLLNPNGLLAELSNAQVVYDLDYEIASNANTVDAVSWDTVIIDDVDAIDLESVNANYSPSIVVDFNDRDRLVSSGWALIEKGELSGNGLLADSSFELKIASELLLNPERLLAEMDDGQVVYDLDYETIFNRSQTQDASWDAVLIDDIDFEGFSIFDSDATSVIGSDRNALLHNGWKTTERLDIIDGALMAYQGFTLPIASDLVIDPSGLLASLDDGRLLQDLDYEIESSIVPIMNDDMLLEALDLSADYRLPIYRESELALGLETLIAEFDNRSVVDDVDYETLYATPNSEITFNDFIINRDSFMAISANIDWVDDVVMQDLDTGEETDERLQGVDLDTGEVITNLWWMDLDDGLIMKDLDTGETLSDTTTPVEPRLARGFTTKDIFYNLDTDDRLYHSKQSMLHIEPFSIIIADLGETTIVRDLTFTTELTEADIYSMRDETDLIVDKNYDFRGIDLNTGESYDSGFLFWDLDQGIYVHFNDGKIHDPDSSYDGYPIADTTPIVENDFMVNAIDAITDDRYIHGLDLDESDERPIVTIDSVVDEDGDLIEVVEPIPRRHTVISIDTPNDIFAVIYATPKLLDGVYGVDLDTGEIYDFGDELHGVDENGERIFLFDFIDLDTEATKIEPLEYLVLNRDVDNTLFDPSYEDFMAITSNGIITELGWERVYETKTVDYQSVELMGMTPIRAYSLNLATMSASGDAFDNVEPLEINKNWKSNLYDPTSESNMAILHDGSGIIRGLHLQNLYNEVSINTGITTYLINRDDTIHARVFSLYETSNSYSTLDLDNGEQFDLNGIMMVDLDTDEVYSMSDIGEEDLDSSIWTIFDFDTITTNTDVDSNAFDSTAEGFTAILHDGSGAISELEYYILPQQYYTKSIETPTETMLIHSMQAITEDGIVYPLDSIELMGDDPIDDGLELDPTIDMEAILSDGAILRGLFYQFHHLFYSKTIETDATHIINRDWFKALISNEDGSTRNFSNLDIMIEQEPDYYYEDVALNMIEAITLDGTTVTEIQYEPLYLAKTVNTNTVDRIINRDEFKALISNEDDSIILENLDIAPESSYYYEDVALSEIEAITLDGTTVTEIQYEPLYLAKMIETTIDYIINRDWFKALISNENGSTKVLDDLSIYTEQDYYYEDVALNMIEAITFDGTTVTEIQYEPLYKMKTIEEVYTTYLINRSEFKAIVDDLAEPISSIDVIDIDEEPKDDLFDVSADGFIAILHDGSGTISGMHYIFDPAYYTKTIETQTKPYLINRPGFGAEIEDNSFTRSVFDIEAMTWNKNVDLNHFDVSAEGFEAIMHDGSGKQDGLFYIFEPKPEVEKMRNFFNIADGGLMAEMGDTTTISGIGYITIWDEYDPRKHQILNVDAEWMRVIDSHDNITHERLVYLSNLSNQIRHLPYEMIDQKGFALATEIDKNSVRLTMFPDLTWATNEHSKIRDLGFVDFEAQKNLMMAIINGDARVIHGLDYTVDGLADNKDVVVYELNDTIFAMTLDGKPITNFHYENHEYSWSNQKLVNISDGLLAMFHDDDRTVENLIFIYDQNRPEIRHYYDESNLQALIDNLDKYLIKEPPHVKLRRYKWGNHKYFVFACPKRVVYKDWHCQTHFTLPDVTSDAIKAKCFTGSTPIYTSGKIPDTDLLADITEAKMEYMGETHFTNAYGYTELYMVWKSNGYFTRLNSDEGLNMQIAIGNGNDYTVFYDRVRESLVNVDLAA